MDMLPSIECVLSENRFGRYCIPHESAHRPAAKVTIAGGVHEPKTVQYVVDHCGKGDVIHAGTFFGDMLPPFSKGLVDGARLWAFEPNTRSHLAAQWTVVLNGLHNVHLFNFGLAAVSTRGSIVIQNPKTGQALGGASYVRKGEGPELPGDVVEAVSLVSIDSIVPEMREVAVIQLDVEGFETEALSGAIRTIRRCRPHLVLESRPAEGWFSAQLAPLGYAERGRASRNYVYTAI